MKSELTKLKYYLPLMLGLSLMVASGYATTKTKRSRKYKPLQEINTFSLTPYLGDNYEEYTLFNVLSQNLRDKLEQCYYTYLFYEQDFMPNIELFKKTWLMDLPEYRLKKLDSKKAPNLYESVTNADKFTLRHFICGAEILVRVYFIGVKQKILVNDTIEKSDLLAKVILFDTGTGKAIATIEATLDRKEVSTNVKHEEYAQLGKELAEAILTVLDTYKL